MLRAVLSVDLPSTETRRNMGPIEWVRSLFGATIDLKSGQEEITISALSLVEGIVMACQRVGIDNAICFLVDKKVVYTDPNDVAGDLPLILEAAEKSGILEKTFREMHLALAHKEAGLHVLLDVKLASQVVLGNEEMEIALTGRVEELRVRAGETAEAYAERVRSFARDGAALEAARHALAAMVDRLADALRASLAGVAVRVVEDAQVRLVRPEAPQIGRFRQLGFGEGVEEPTYRAVPTYRRAGAYADPFYYYYYDPYYDFTNWVMLDTMMHGHMWHTPYLHVVDPLGNELAFGHGAQPGDGWGSDTVSFDGGGGLVVDPSIPDAGLDAGHGGPWGDAGEGGSTADGWGHDSLSGGSGSDTSGASCSTGSSCSSGSSCGSSCSSGSSCGSSCGSN